MCNSSDPGDEQTSRQMPQDDFHDGDESQLPADMIGIGPDELVSPDAELAEAGGRAGLRSGSDVSLLGVENGLEDLKSS